MRFFFLLLSFLLCFHFPSVAALCKSATLCKYVCGACLHGLRQWCTLATAIIQKHFSDQCLSFASFLPRYLHSPHFLLFLAFNASGEKLMHAKWWCFLRIVRTSHFLSTFWSLIKFYILSESIDLAYACDNEQQRTDDATTVVKHMPKHGHKIHIHSCGWLHVFFSFCTQFNENDCAVINFNLPKSSYFMRGELGIWFWCCSITW